MKNKYINCKLEYECPTEKWLQLVPTESPIVKYCAKCAQKIYFCSDQLELNKRISEGAICVAFFKKTKQKLAMQSPLVMGKFVKPKKSDGSSK